MLVGARASPLSKAQVIEVERALKEHYPQLSFCPIYLESTGDKDQKTSLRTLGKTDFFTREIDQLLLQKRCRIAIHSAKDLPQPIPKGLTIVALTKGVDPSDVLVMRPGFTLNSLPKNARIATSSERREAAVKELRADADFRFLDLRGTIGERLKKLEFDEADGVVVAEAALIRLGLTHLNRITIPDCTTPYQGQLAVLAREDDAEIFTLFEKLDMRKKVLYTGLEPPISNLEERLIHYPLISVVPRPPPIVDVKQFSHVIFGSKNGVRVALSNFPTLSNLVGIAVGRSTAREMRKNGFTDIHIAEQEQSEGIVALLDALNLQKAHIFWPHAAGSRPVLREALRARNLRFKEWVAYDTIFTKPPPLDLSSFKEVQFTSSSTVEAFASIYPKPPRHLKLNGIGPITELSIAKYLSVAENSKR